MRIYNENKDFIESGLTELEDAPKTDPTETWVAAETPVVVCANTATPQTKTENGYFKSDDTKALVTKVTEVSGATDAKCTGATAVAGKTATYNDKDGKDVTSKVIVDAGGSGAVWWIIGVLAVVGLGGGFWWYKKKGASEEGGESDMYSQLV